MTQDTGLFDALRRAASTALAMFQSRLELASLELGESGQRLLVSVMLGLFGVLLLVGALMMATVWLVMLWWVPHGPLVLAAFALLYLVLGLLLLAWTRRRMRREPPLLAATIGELQRDAALLRGGNSAPPR